MQDPTPTADDRERVQYAIEHRDEILVERLVQIEARERVERERLERRRRMWNRISFGLLARE